MKEVKQKEVEDAKKPPRPGYQGPEEEKQEGPGKPPKRWKKREKEDL